MKDPWVNYKGLGAFKGLGAGGGCLRQKKKTREER